MPSRFANSFLAMKFLIKCSVYYREISYHSGGDCEEKNTMKYMQSLLHNKDLLSKSKNFARVQFKNIMPGEQRERELFPSPSLSNLPVPSKG